MFSRKLGFQALLGTLVVLAQTIPNLISPQFVLANETVSSINQQQRLIANKVINFSTGNRLTSTTIEGFRFEFEVFSSLTEVLGGC